MYQTNYPGPVNQIAQTAPSPHPQTNQWAGEISGTESTMPLYSASTSQQDALVFPYTSDPTSLAYPGTTENPIAPSVGAAPQLNMNHGLSDAIIHTPQTSDEAYMGSLKAMLNNNVGNHIVASFLIGSRNLMSLEGTLYEVGNNYLTIYQEALGRYVIGDFYSLKFAEFNEKDQLNNGNSSQSNNGWQQSM